MSTSAARAVPSFTPRTTQSRRPSVGNAQAYVPQSEGSLARKAPAPSCAEPAGSRAAPERLRVVEGQRGASTRGAWPFVLLAAIAGLVAILFPLILNTQMAQRSYDIRDLQIELAELRIQTSVLEGKVLQASAPDSLEEKAREIGLLPSAGTGVITLEDATVEGGVPAW